MNGWASMTAFARKAAMTNSPHNSASSRLSGRDLPAAFENVRRRSRTSKGKLERKASSGVGTRMFAPAALAAGITPSSRNRLTWSHVAGTLGLPVGYGGFANHTQPPLSSDSRGRSILSTTPT